MDSIGSRIKSKRKELNLTMEDLKEATGVSLGTISSLENDKYSPSSAVLVALSNMLNVSIDWIITGKQFQESENQEEFKELLKLYSQLNEKNRIKIEGVIEGLIMAQSESDKANRELSASKSIEQANSKSETA